MRKKTTIYLETELDRALDVRAEHEGTSKAAVIRRVLWQAVEGFGRPRVRAIGVGEGPGDVACDVDRHLDETGFGRG